MKLERLDHLVSTVRDLATTVDFYTRILDLEHNVFGANRQAVKFGRQKINLHPTDAPIAPHAEAQRPVSADLCFITATPLPEVAEHLLREWVAIEAGPVARTGALGPISSVYLRDPDGNLLEISTYDS